MYKSFNSHNNMITIKSKRKIRIIILWRIKVLE